MIFGFVELVVMMVVFLEFVCIIVWVVFVFGEYVELIKVVGYEWLVMLFFFGLWDCVEVVVVDVGYVGWDEFVCEQCVCLDDYWVCVDVEVEGELWLQQVVCYVFFQVFQVFV